MAYDDELAERVREIVEGEPGLSEKRMFGGLAFLLHGNLAVAASSQGGLMLRVDPAEHDVLLLDPAASPFEMHGRSMNGWLRIAIDAEATDEELETWVERGVTYARTLPPKS